MSVRDARTGLSGRAAGTVPGESDLPGGASGGRPYGTRGRALASAATVLAAAALVVVVWPSGRGSRGRSDNPVRTSAGTITRGTLISRTAVSATLGYAGSYHVVDQVPGTYTALPAAGRVIRRGQVLYRVDGSPVLLLYGRVPAYRPLSEGMTGPDVRQLNAGLVTLGYASPADLDPSSDYFSGQTTYAVEKLQARLGVAQTGTVSLGQVAFLPSAIRVTTVPATLGGPAVTGSPALTGSSTTPVVTISLAAARQSYVRSGDVVMITLPDLRRTPGVITSVGTVATAAASGPGSSGPAGATIPVEVKMTHPAAASGLDQAPVQVSITTARARNVLAVPVTALLATASGGYEVEVAGPAGRSRFIPVTLGLFDDAAGLVQVTGPGLRAGQKVVRAQT